MLGDKIGEIKGKVTGQRVLPGQDYRYIQMEMTVQQAGQILGLQGEDHGTYVVYERVPGQMYGEGRGGFYTETGEGAIWNGHGIGRMTGPGMAMQIRFSLAFQADPNGKLARLNGVLVVGEHNVDSDGNATSTMWEWK